MGLPSLKQSFVIGSTRTREGSVPRVLSSLAWADRLGMFKARWGIRRMHYTVDPGLYALGEPDRKSPVLVTANYKMSFDKLREALPGRDAWILVLNTRDQCLVCLRQGDLWNGRTRQSNRFGQTGANRFTSRTHFASIVGSRSGCPSGSEIVRVQGDLWPHSFKRYPCFFGWRT